MQATKTSLDSYVSVLMMENKVVTKKVLERAGISVRAVMNTRHQRQVWQTTVCMQGNLW